MWQLSKGVKPHGPPTRTERYQCLAQSPGAAAIQFERLIGVVYRFVLGWDRENGRPLKAPLDTDQQFMGGLLGVTEAFEFVVEEQGRLSLHMHCLVWSAGHMDIIDRMEEQLPGADVFRAVQHVVNPCFRYPNPRKTTEEIEWEVEGIRGRREVAGEIQYHVKWRGYKDLTWEPADYLENAQQLVDAFNAGLQPENKAGPPVAIQPSSNRVSDAKDDKTDVNLCSSLRAVVSSLICSELCLSDAALATLAVCPRVGCGGKIKLRGRTYILKLRYCFFPSNSFCSDGR